MEYNPELLSFIPLKCYSLSRVQLFVTPRTVAHKALLSMEFSKQEYLNGLPFPTPRDLPDPEIEPGSPALQILYQLSYQYTMYIYIYVYVYIRVCVHS